MNVPRRQRGILLICLMVAGTQATWGLMIPVLPVYVETLGAGAAAAGAAVTAFGVGRLVINVPAGMASNRWNQRALLVGGVLFVAAATAVTGFVGSIEQLLAARLLTGVGGGIVITTGQAMLSHTDPARLGRTMSLLQGFQMAGSSMGPAFGGFLVIVGPSLPYVVCGGLLVMLALAGSVLRLPNRREHGATSGGGTGPKPRSVWSLSLVAVSLVGLTVFLVRFGGQQFLFPVLAYERAGLTPTTLGLAITGATAVTLLLVPVAGRLTDRWGRRPTVVVAMLGLAVSTLGFLASPVPAGFVTALVVTSVAMALTGPSTAAFLAETTSPEQRGTAVGIFRTFGDLGIIVGPILLGWLLGRGLEDLAIIALAAMAVIAAVVFVILTATRRGPAPTTP